MRCPNTKCHSRLLRLEAEAEAEIVFTKSGAVDHITYEDWYLTEDSDVACTVCHWVGHYRHCKEAGDTLPLVPTPPAPPSPPAPDPHVARLIEILEGQATLVVALRDVPEQYLDMLVRLRHMETMLHVLTQTLLPPHRVFTREAQ